MRATPRLVRRVCAKPCTLANNTHAQARYIHTTKRAKSRHLSCRSGPNTRSIPCPNTQTVVPQTHTTMPPSIDSTEPPAAANGAADSGSNPPSPASRAPEPGLPPLVALPPHTKPKPLPKWLQLRIKASTLFSRSRRLGTGNVIVLPFNKIAKLDVPANEIAAMRFVRANTSIPIPESESSSTIIIIPGHFPRLLSSPSLPDFTSSLIPPSTHQALPSTDLNAFSS